MATRDIFEDIMDFLKSPIFIEGVRLPRPDNNGFGSACLPVCVCVFSVLSF